ncbi:MAG: AAA-like domain-containing protein [Nostoc sp. ChiQUE01a]|nr:AAA-like domain-containing protein [Nostoc sp. ChiQUE01a]
MSTAPNLDIKYQVGGSLPADHPTYVKRQADTDFYNYLKNTTFCYVLNSRQMGKSSLRVHTMKQLQDENKNIICISIDVSAVREEPVTPDKWFKSFLSKLANLLTKYIKEKDSEFSFSTWLEENKHLSPLQQLYDFIEKEVLIKIPEHNIVIFIDEIDSLISLKFKDDFFRFIRTCCNYRADYPNYKRLTFAILGVAQPSDLIGDIREAPFNHAHREIELTGFKFNETQPLWEKLIGKITHPQIALEIVLKWTGGQPFITQRVCELIYDNHSDIEDENKDQCIENLVREHIIDKYLGSGQDMQNHFQTIESRLLKSQQRKELLAIYKQILQKGKIIANRSHEQIELQLSGLVVREEGDLKVYNEIYKNIFNISWVERELKNISSSSEENNFELETEVEKLYEGLKAGDFCYVLSSQLTDKDEFLTKINSYLEAKNTQFVIINSDKIYEESNRRQFDWKGRGQWYLSVAKIINKKFDLNYQTGNFNINDWWRNNKDSATDPNQGQELLINYIETQLLKIEKEHNIIIIFDSISFSENGKDDYRLFDIINGFDFKDEIFNLLCSCYERRRENSDFEKLTFLLLDVIVDSECIPPDVKNITIGWRINLGNASEQQAKPIITHGLNKKFNNVKYEIMLDRISYWTSGHPFLTQQLLKIVLNDVTSGQQENYIDYIDKLVKRQITTPFKNA